MMQEVKRLPYPLESLDQMGRDTFEALKSEKPLILSIGYSAAYYLDFFLDSLEKYGVKNFEVAKVHQSDEELPEHREVEEPSKPINPIGCHKAIIFDNSTRSFRSLAGAFKYVLPNCPKWGVYEVYAFIMIDENGGSNSTALPLYQALETPLPYIGPLHALYEKAPNIFKELDKEKFTEYISTWASPIHSSTNLKTKIEEKLINVERMLFNIRHRPPRPQRDLNIT